LKVIGNGRCYGMEMNVEETKAMRTSKQQFPVHIMLDQKQLESVKYFLIIDASSTREIE
jgi:hypothetical protein